MGYSFLNACVVGTIIANIVNPSREGFLVVISGTKGVIFLSKFFYESKRHLGY